MSELELYRFAKWVASEVCQNDFEENAGAFAEIACRKLFYLGFLTKDEKEWHYRGGKVE